VAAVGGVMNQYDPKQIKHREDTDLTWKTSPKRREKPRAPANNNLTIFWVVTDRRRFTMR
jgi:hypothetical protein